MKKTTILWRGLKGKCPRCGKGKLLQGYIKQNITCSACNEDFSKLQAQDGPAWLTILFVGHLLAPLVLFMGKTPFLDDAFDMLFLMMLTLISAAIVLPIAKGLFIAALWLIKQKP